MTAHYIILSGGLDSVTLLYHVRKELALASEPVLALSFFYEQRHARELDCAREVCETLIIPHLTIPLPFLPDFSKNSSLTNRAVKTPNGHYASENMEKTVVPGRNTLFLALALAVVEGSLMRGEEAVIYYGAHSGSHRIYPDCRPDYADAMYEVVRLASAGRVNLCVPFLEFTKEMVVELGLSLGVDYAKTHTCYDGQYPACGECASCLERLDAFAQNGVRDPLPYAVEEAGR